jgi:quercetin dioxygenase-like cupin family protein
MRHFVSGVADTVPVGVVDVARWDQYSLGGTMPFGAMWYTIPPGGSGTQDCHPDLELSLVLQGTATVEEHDGNLTQVRPGEAFLLGPNEKHIISNRTEEPLLVFSAYWMPVDGSGDQATPADAAPAAEGPAAPASLQ